MGAVTDAIQRLRDKEASTGCEQMVGLLRKLGFEVQRRHSGNHHVMDHDGIPGFTGANFDGGHDKHLKAVYVRQLRKLLEKYSAEISAALLERNDEQSR